MSKLYSSTPIDDTNLSSNNNILSSNDSNLSSNDSNLLSNDSNLSSNDNSSDLVLNNKIESKNNIKIESKNNNKKKYPVLKIILIGIVLILYFVGLYKLLTSNNLKDLYDSDSNKYIILFNLLISYLMIISVLIFLFYNKNKIIINMKNNYMFKYISVILTFFFIFYIFCILRFSYILKNYNNNYDLKFDFFINYYIFIEFIPFILFLFYVSKYKNQYIVIEN
jgi:hypothetical protein